MLWLPYECEATEEPHWFLGNSDRDRVPQQFGELVCKDHLAEVNRCRRDKGLEPLTEFPDSYIQTMPT